MSGFFSIKNWDQYQHYKDRDPTWIKLYNRLLDNYDFGLLPDASKWHLIGTFLLASRYKNKIPADAGWVAKKIGATQTVDLTLLENAGFIEINHSCTTLLAEPYQDAIPEKEEQVTSKRKIPSLRSGSARAGAAPRTKMPDDWPSEHDRGLAQAFWQKAGRQDLADRIETEVVKARAHHLGKGTRSADWSQSWITWYTRALEMSRAPSKLNPYPTATIHKVVQ